MTVWFLLQAWPPALKNADQAAWGVMVTKECAVCLITESPVKNTAPSARLAQKALSVISLSARRVISLFCFTSPTKGSKWLLTAIKIKGNSAQKCRGKKTRNICQGTKKNWNMLKKKSWRYILEQDIDDIYWIYSNPHVGNTELK